MIINVMVNLVVVDLLTSQVEKSKYDLFEEMKNKVIVAEV